MARPKKLNKKGYFSILVHLNMAYLTFNPTGQIIKFGPNDSGTRSQLYRDRLKYSSWFNELLPLFEKYFEKINKK